MVDFNLTSSTPIPQYLKVINKKTNSFTFRTTSMKR